MPEPSESDIQAFNSVMENTGIQADETGRTVVTPEPEGQPAAEAPAPEPTPEPSQVESTAPETETRTLPEDFEQRLRWDNWDPEAIELAKSSLSADKLLSMYESVEKRQNRVDRLYHERNERTRAPQEQPKEEEQPKAPSLKDALGERASQLGDDVVADLERYIDTRVKEATPPPPQQDPAREQALTEQVEANRARLEGMYPSERLDGAYWDDFVRDADIESRNPYYVENFSDHREALQAVFDTVAFRRFGRGFRQPVPNGQETTTSSGPATRNSAAAPPVNRQVTDDLTPKERERIIFEHLARNPNDMDGARRAAGYGPLNLHPRQVDRPRNRR